jgi:hypothetical protein
MSTFAKRLVICAGSILVIPAAFPQPAYYGDQLLHFCDGKQPDANYPNPENCGSFINCNKQGQAYVLSCPSGLQYLPGQGHCDRPQDGAVSCPANTTPAPAEQAPGS